MNTRPTSLKIVTLGLALGLLAPVEALLRGADEPKAAPAGGSAREMIINKMERIRLDTVHYDGLPLSEVVLNLRDEARKRDPEKKGINFMLNPNSVVSPPAEPGGVAGEAIDLNSIAIRIIPPLNDVRLLDAVEAVVKVADRPIQYSVEDYGVVFSVRGSDPRASDEAGFVFGGGTPNDLLNAVQFQLKVDWRSVANIPTEMANVQIPKLRFNPGSVGPSQPRAGGESGPLAALVSLYNQLGEQKPELGRLIVKGELRKPSVVVFVPDKAAVDIESKIKVKAFSIYEIDKADRAKLQTDIDRARGEAMISAAHLRRSAGIRNLEGSVAMHEDTSLLVATGPESFVEMVESIVNAYQERERARHPATSPTPAAGK